MSSADRLSRGGEVDAEGLMNMLVEFAEKMLVKHGEFHPFGGYLKGSGEVIHVGVASGTAKEKVSSLESSFSQMAGEKQGVVFGVVTNVTLPASNGAPSDAIKIFLEHEDGYCAEVFLRYEVADSVLVTDVIAQQGDPRFFG